MSIHDRDYMRRREEPDEPAPNGPANRIEAFFNRFMSRHPRFFLYAVVAMAALLAVGLAALKFHGRR